MSPETASADQADIDLYRLPRTVVPRRYDLLIAPDLTTHRFHGTVVVEVDVVEPTAQVVLNAVDLTVARAEIVTTTGTHVADELVVDTETQRLSADFGAPLPTGPASLTLVFDGELNDLLRGFYRSTYTAADGTTRTLATTQFESTSARRAFPCFDEPDLKAVFGVTLEVADGLMAVSCGPLVSSEPGSRAGTTRHRFGDTMPMSTYLLAFVVGELEASETVDVDGVPLRIVHAPGKGDLVDFGLTTAAAALRFLVDYYGIPYPAQKLDLIAVPDFAAGAMENLGCVTFRESLLLVDPESATLAELDSVANVISHELAHMWFGDLVTMDWWNGIWLKEAFATFMAMLTVDALHPEWHVWDKFGRDRTAAFDIDALESTRPIEYPVISPADAEGMYDVLTYEKGAAVVRMLEQYLGAERFRDGVRLYLERHSYGVVSTTDLWDALEESSGEPVRSTMDSWIFQGGYPILGVTASATGLHLTQHRFGYGEVEDRRWSVPVIVRAPAVGRGDEHRVLLTDAKQELQLGGTPAWAVANSGAHGFYRVRYDGDLLAPLLAQAQEVLGPAERYALVDDAWAAVLAAELEAAAYLDLTDGFSFESDVGVWRVITDGLRSLDRIVDDATRTALQQRVNRLLSTALDIVGYEPADDEDELTRELRAVLLAGAAKLGNHRGALARSREIVDRIGQAGARVEPNLAAAAVSVVASHGGPADHALFVERFRSATTPQEEMRYLMALAEFPGAEEFGATLDMLLGEVRSQNAPLVLGAAIAHRDRGPEAWAFARDHWGEVVARFPSNLVLRVLGGIRAISQPDVAADVERFLATIEVPQGKLLVRQYIEKMKVNVALREREHHRLAVSLRG